MRLTLKNISETIKFYQAEAAKNERQGDEISDDTVSAINRLQKYHNFIQLEIEKKKKGKKIVSDLYNKNIKCFQKIKPEKTEFTNRKRNPP